MEARPNEPGAPGRNREEGSTSQVTSSRGAVVRGQKSVIGLEEDWIFLGTDDPAFWLKDPERD